jgi:CRISPR-associated protein Csm1
LHENAEWPSNGLAIEGDFSGIQRFVLRPTPGAGGAARRLRARSFRVLALTRIVADAVESHFRNEKARLFYSAGGRFLVFAGRCHDWRERLASLQRDLDRDLLHTYRGELVFHLGAAEFNDGKIPVNCLAETMRMRKRTPLQGALIDGQRWAKDGFFRTVTSPEKCQGCGATGETVARQDERLCQACIDDQELGASLLGRGDFGLTPSDSGAIALLGRRWTAARNGRIPIRLIPHAPQDGGNLLTFDQLAKRAPGRSYLAYLRIDADRIGEKFRHQNGDARKTVELSNQLNDAFSSKVGALLAREFPDLYPVYGGGDDLFLIGPWNAVFDFAEKYRAEFRTIRNGELTFSAGVALARPREHILTKSEEAEEAIHRAKVTRDSIHALGATIPFADFSRVLSCARNLARLHGAGQVRSALLYNLMELHHRYRALKNAGSSSGTSDQELGNSERGLLWHALLFYQITRNTSGETAELLRKEFLTPGYNWKYADFIARYAMLVAGKKGED